MTQWAIVTTAPDGTQSVIGPYSCMATADLRAQELETTGIDAFTIRMERDSDVFPTPVGNRTNH